MQFKLQAPCSAATGRTDMPLILRCFPQIRDSDYCICKASLKTSTKIIGWVTLLISLSVSITYAMRLSHFREHEFRTSINESKELCMLQLAGHTTMATLSFLLLLGVYYDFAGLMLPSLLMQLFAETSLVLIHPVRFLVSGGSNTIYGPLAVAACIIFIGVFTFLWLVQYNCYRQFVEMYRCNSGKEMKAMSEYSGCVTYHTEGNQGDCTVTNAVFTTHALTMNEDDNHARSVRASSRITFIKEVFLTN